MLEELKKHNAIVQERIMKSFGYPDTEDFIQKGEDEVELIQKGEIDYDWELEKAVYADTAQNRRLNRVGQEYHRGRSKKEEKNDMRNADGRMNKNSKLVQRMWSLQHKVDDGKASDEESKEYATLRGMAIGKSKEEAIKEYEERLQKTKEKKDHLSGRRTKEERL